MAKSINKKQIERVNAAFDAIIKASVPDKKPKPAKKAAKKK